LLSVLASILCVCYAENCLKDSSGTCVAPAEILAGCDEKGPCLAELTDEIFEYFVDTRDLTLVGFYEGDARLGWDSIKDAFDGLAKAIEQRGLKRLSVGKMDITTNPKTSSAAAVTGPFSVKLFDKRLSTESFFNIHVYHNQGLKYDLTPEETIDMMQEYLRNSTGHPKLDNLARKMVEEGLENGFDKTTPVIEEAQALSTEHPKSGIYISMLEILKKTGAAGIAGLFNQLKVEAGLYTSGQTLENRAEMMLRLHIARQFTIPLMGSEDKVPTYTRKYTIHGGANKYKKKVQEDDTPKLPPKTLSTLD